MLCSSVTEDESFDKSLLGCHYTGKIAAYLGDEHSLLRPGTPIVLFNFKTGVAHVNILATSVLQKDIDPEAFQGNYSYQIRVDTSRVGWALCDNNFFWRAKMKAGQWLTKLEYMMWYNRVPWEEAEWYSESKDASERLEMGHYCSGSDSDTCGGSGSTSQYSTGSDSDNCSGGTSPKDWSSRLDEKQKKEMEMTGLELTKELTKELMKIQVVEARTDTRQRSTSL